MPRMNIILFFITANFLLFSSCLVANETTSNNNYKIGVCALIENQPQLPLSATSTISPVLLAYGYLTKELKFPRESITAEMYNAAKINVIKEPEYGKLDFDKAKQNAAYIPNNKNFYGIDSSTFTITLGKHNVKLLYSFNVLMQVENETEEYSPYKDKNKCPKGRTWKM